MDTQTAASNFTCLEVRELLTSLSEADIARLIQIYRNQGCEPRAGLTAHDILSQVSYKALTMERPWPRGVDVLQYFVETGRSVISNEEKKFVRQITTDPVAMDGQEVDPQTSEPWMEMARAPDVQIEENQSDAKLNEWIRNIEELFVDDEDATCFITQKLAEIKKAAILLACKFNDQVYRNVEKRIKDKVRKRFPKGFPWWEIEG